VARAEPIEINIEVHPDVILDEAALRVAAARKARVNADDVRGGLVRRRSIDARRGRVRINALVQLFLRGAPPPMMAPRPLDLPAMASTLRVAIVGSGPAGMFCAWRLAQAGIRSVIFERGKRIRARRRDLARLSQRGELDAESNYCFGEGGAGTFSDGKLYTRSHKRGSIQGVLDAFAAYGAPAEILVDARPHIGTNKLPRVITSMREHLESAGVEFRFATRVSGLLTKEGRAVGVELADGSRIEAQAVVSCPGHSARDVVEWTARAGAVVSFKPFAVGVRIEHPQSAIDRIQFGDLAGHPALGAAYYRLVEHAGETSVYSFCMCPGGFIVPAATDPGQLVVNGMSPSHRRGRFANSGLVTEVSRETIASAGFDATDELCGLHYQADLERRAYEAGGGDFRAPAQTLLDLVEARQSKSLPECSYHRGLNPYRLDELLRELAAPVQTALERLGRRMPGFVSADALAVGVESRTSAPYRIERDRETGQARGLDGLYPCGEGAGFAGGIVSAALDGIQAAEAIVRAS
jgi:uncharacterized FAD-dependent dehydrogenase